MKKILKKWINELFDEERDTYTRQLASIEKRLLSVEKQIDIDGFGEIHDKPTVGSAVISILQKLDMWWQIEIRRKQKEATAYEEQTVVVFKPKKEIETMVKLVELGE